MKPKQRITKKLFEKNLMKKYGGDMRISKRNNLYIYFASHGHCGTWINGKGWEFENE